jgi:heme-degrading monooxygenase HmoA
MTDPDSRVIARIWRGTTAAEHGDEYLEYVRRTGIAEYRATPGFRDVQVLRRTRDGRTTLTVISYWDSLDAIKAFAGDDPEIAHYYPEDAAYLLEREDRVEHHEVFDLD